MYIYNVNTGLITPPTGQQGQQGLARKSKNRVPRNKVTRVHPSTIIMVNHQISMGKD